MGLRSTDVERSYEHYLRNSTKCSTWSKVKGTHLRRGRRVLDYRHVLGTVAVLAAGLAASLFLAAAETRGTNSRKRRRRQAVFRECPPPPPPSRQDTPQIDAAVGVSIQLVRARLESMQEEDHITGFAA